MIKWEEKEYLKQLYDLALSVELRPFEFWQMMPAEVVDAVKFYFKRKAEEEKEHWKRARWQTYWNVNMQGKVAEKEIKEIELGILFDDEVKKEEAKKLSPKEMREHAIKLATYYMKKLPGFIKKGKGGGPKIYGEN